MLVDAELAILTEEERLAAQEMYMARKPGRRPRLDTLNRCFAAKPAEAPDHELLDAALHVRGSVAEAGAVSPGALRDVNAHAALASQGAGHVTSRR
jgi:hypothetical protein